MNSKFLRICESVRRKLNEANDGTYNPLTADPNNSPTPEDINISEPAEQIKMSDTVESDTQLVSNDQILSLLASFKVFLQNEKIKNYLKEEEILNMDSYNKILMLPNTISDKNALTVTTELIKILDPTKKETNIKEVPQEVPDSRF